MTLAKKLADMKLALPAVPKPVGSYVPAVRAGQFVVTSGQLPSRDGKLICTGKVGAEVTLAQAAEAAKQAAINALAAAASVLVEAGEPLVSGLERIERIVKVTVYVSSAPGFTDQPKVANGASDVLVEIFGENGRHARSAVGAAELPLNAPVELELTCYCP